MALGLKIRVLTTVVATLIGVTRSATPDQWKSRSIYQLLTDRFARTDQSTTAACASGYEGYCGGSWQGIINKLDYIQGMGFDAIWISPITAQIDDPSRAYHGYSQQDLYTVNTNFGSYEDLQSLSSALHARGMYLMVDVVANHFGYNGNVDTIDYSTMTPFNKQSDFHPVCWITDYTNQTQAEQCWLGNADYPLPDVDTTLSSVRSTYNSWIQGLIANYSVDGLRIDTVRDVEQDFWPGFQSAAGIYAVGEVADGDVGYVCPYQDYLDAVLNYPMYYQITQFFSNTAATSANLVSQMAYLNTECKDPTLLAPFTENHDQPRFPSYTEDMSLDKNAIIFSMLADGIPIVYSGQEQHLNGGDDPYDREAIWLTGYDTSAELYQMIAKVNQIRKLAISKASTYTGYWAINVYTDNNNIAMRKGDTGSQIVAVYNNMGSSASSYPLKITGYHDFTAGETVTDVLSCSDVTVASDGTFTVTVTSGLPLVFFAKSGLSGSGICSQ